MSWVEEFRQHEATCRRSPSAHNTQPWIVRYGDDRVTIEADPDRCLPDSDPTRRDLFLSLGAFVETCLVVAAGAGLEVRAEVAVDGDRVAQLVPATSVYPTPFTASDVERRGCARGAYAPGRLDAATLADLSNHGVVLRELPCHAVAATLVSADRWMFGTPAVARELRRWLRLSPRHPRYHLDGLTDRALELARAEAAGLAAVLSPAVYPVARRLGLSSALAAASRELLRYDGSVLVVVGRVAEPADLMAHGRALMRVWLALCRRGLAVHPLSQILDCQATADGLRAMLDLPPDHSALAVFRAGRPVRQPARSARIPVAVPVR